MLPGEKRIKTVKLAKTKSPCHKILELNEAKAAMAGAVVSSNMYFFTSTIYFTEICILLQICILLKYVFYSKEIRN